MPAPSARGAAMESAIAISVAVLLAAMAGEQVEGVVAGASAWTEIDQLWETVRRRFADDIVGAVLLRTDEHSLRLGLHTYNGGAGRGTDQR